MLPAKTPATLMSCLNGVAASSSTPMLLLGMYAPVRPIWVSESTSTPGKVVKPATSMGVSSAVGYIDNLATQNDAPLLMRDRWAALEAENERQSEGCRGEITLNYFLCSIDGVSLESMLFLTVTGPIALDQYFGC